MMSEFCISAVTLYHLTRKYIHIKFQTSEKYFGTINSLITKRFIYLSCEILFVVLYLMLVFIDIKFRSCCCRDLTDKSCCFLNLHCSLIPLFFPGRKPYHMYQLSQHFVESYLYDKNFHRFAFLSDSRL